MIKPRLRQELKEMPHLACLKNSLPSIRGVRAGKKSFIYCIHENHILELYQFIQVTIFKIQWTWECAVARWRICSRWLLTWRVPECWLCGRNCTWCSFRRNRCRIASRGYTCGDDLWCCSWGKTRRDVWCHWKFVSSVFWSCKVKARMLFLSCSI